MNNQKTTKDIGDYWEMVCRRKWWLIVPALFGTAISVFISVTAPAYYRSSTLIIVEQQTVPTMYVTPTDTTPVSQRLSTIKQQILSRTKLEHVIKDLELYDEEDNSFSAKVMRKAGLSGDSKPSKEKLVEVMRDNIEVKVMGRAGRGRGGDAFTISFVDKRPRTAMEVTNTLASLFIEENLKIREQYSEGTSEFLKNELDKAKQDLVEQENTLRQFKENSMGSLPEQLDSNLRTLDRLQLQLQSLRAAIKSAEDREAFLGNQSTMGAGDATVGVDPRWEELGRLRQELARLSSTFKETYPDIVITRNRIKDIESELAAGRGSDVEDMKSVEPQSPLQAELASARSLLSTLKGQEARTLREMKKYEKRVEQTPLSEQRMLDIQRNYDVSFVNYQALLEKRLNARLAENMEKRQKGEKFRVVDPANLPDQPFKPNRVRMLLLGVVLSIGVGVGLVFVLEFLNPEFLKPEDFVGVLPHPVLAAIPTFTSSGGNKVKKELRLISGYKEKRGKSSG
ncbi:MAG: GumC family protein [Thermodesulfobacteriota bacterium]